MKKHFRYLTFLPLLLIMILGPALSSDSQAAPGKGTIDPACLSACQQEQFACFIEVIGSNSDENHCLARYRHCIAQCGKH